MNTSSTPLALRPATVRTLHRLSGAVLGAFLIAHIANQLAALAGLAAHRAMLEALRVVYRFPPAEALLLACVALQVASGLRLAMRGWGKWRGKLPLVQALSGLYLAFFLLLHVGAVLAGRGFMGLDTDFRFAAAGIHVPPFGYFFVPYYLLAVASAGIHIACALRRTIGTRGALAVAVGGCVAACLVVAALSGMFYSVDIPAEYRAVFTL